MFRPHYQGSADWSKASQLLPSELGGLKNIESKELQVTL